MGTIPMFGFTNQMNETPAQFFRPAPKIGEHNDSIIALVGYPKQQVETLIQSGALHSEIAAGWN